MLFKYLWIQFFCVTLNDQKKLILESTKKILFEWDFSLLKLHKILGF